MKNKIPCYNDLATAMRKLKYFFIRNYHLRFSKDRITNITLAIENPLLYGDCVVTYSKMILTYLGNEKYLSKKSNGKNLPEWMKKQQDGDAFIM